MAIQTKKPVDLAERVAHRRGGGPPRRRGRLASGDLRLPRTEARAKAREFFERFPKAAYMTEIESWRELADDEIEFVMRRLPTAD